MSSLIPSAAALGLAALAALCLALGRRPPLERRAELDAASWALGLATAVQTIHFAEEAATGFHVRFPAMFGLDGMSFPVFVVFNLAWLVIWVVSIPGLRSASTFAFFAAWFLAIAGILNGIAHPGLALVSGSYFPGLVTSPVIGAVSVFLWIKLRVATREG